MRVKCDHQSVYRMENETNLKPIAQIATVSICFLLAVGIVTKSYPCRFGKKNERYSHSCFPAVLGRINVAETFNG